MPGLARSSSYSTNTVSATGFTATVETPGMSRITRSKPTAHEAQSAPLSSSCSVIFCFIASLANQDLAMEHVHAAREGVFTRLVRMDFNGRRLVQSEMLAYAEVGQHHFFQAVARVLAKKVEGYGLP